MIRFIDLNVDLGEGCPWDDALLALATSASICCGRHAGGEAVALRTLEVAKRRGVTVGAHPGYDDRAHFGRIPHSMSTNDLATLVREQLDDLIGWCDRVDIAVRFIKPHGALYNQAQRERAIAQGVVEGSRHLGLPIVGLPVGILRQEVTDAGLRYVAEGFVDRRYDTSGELLPRSHPDALLSDPREIAEQVERLLDRGEVQTLCVHGDRENAVELATQVRSLLDRPGVCARSFV